ARPRRAHRAAGRPRLVHPPLRARALRAGRRDLHRLRGVPQVAAQLGGRADLARRLDLGGPGDRGPAPGSTGGRPVSWAAHQFETYAIQAHLPKRWAGRISYLAIVVGDRKSTRLN